MTSKIEAMRQALDGLIQEGFVLTKRSTIAHLRENYHKWYTRSLPVVRQLLPDRLDEFRLLYDGTRNEYGIRASLLGYAYVFPKEKLETQVRILESAGARLSDRLSDIKGVLQADLFDSELDVARELRKNGHLRAAGAVAGVVLEGHLKELVEKRQLKLSKKKPTMSDYYEALRAADVIDLSTWRRLQWLADIRNLCDHKAEREPTADEVAKLIDGTQEITKTLG